MTEQQFDDVVFETLQQLKDTLVVKGKEYRRNKNPFHNFDQGARKKNQIREKIIDGFSLKHEISIDDMVNDIEKHRLPEEATVHEKFNNLLIYTIIKKASVLSRIEEQKNSITSLADSQNA